MAQFRLRTLFIVTAASSLMLWALYVPPQWLGLLAIYLLYFVLAAAAVSGVVFHRGSWQAFFIGVVPWPAIGSLMIVAQHIGGCAPFWLFDRSLTGIAGDEMIVFKISLSIPLFIGIASGAVAVCVRWWAILLQQRSDQKASD
jgi:hypothetical protein